MSQSSSSGGMSAAVDLPDDASDVPLLHRRINPFDNRNAVDEANYLRQNIAVLRCLSVDAVESEGVHDVRTVAPYTTIRNGKIDPPPKACVGLSVMPVHDPEFYVVETNRGDDDFGRFIRIGRNKIQRFFCYGAPSSGLPPQYKVHRDKRHHAHIYSPEQCILERSNTVGAAEDVCNAIYRAILPEISNMPWGFCCSLLAVGQIKYDSMVAGTYVAPTFRAKDVADVYTAISESQFMSRDVSSCDKSRELCDWLEDHLQHGSLNDLSRHPSVLVDIIVQLTEHQFETEDVSCSIRAYELRSALEAIAEELEARSKAGTS